MSDARRMLCAGLVVMETKGRWALLKDWVL